MDLFLIWVGDDFFDTLYCNVGSVVVALFLFAGHGAGGGVAAGNWIL